jgi:hypothetical protein
VEVEQQALEYVRSYVRFGFYRPAEVERIVGEDVFAGAIPRERLRELVQAEVARLKTEQASWPAVTDCDRLDQAFAALEAEGILAVHDAGAEPSDGISEVSERYREAGGAASRIVGYCFYHRQDMEYALKHGELSLAFGDIKGDNRKGVEIGQRVGAALAAAGLRVAWSGSIDEELDIPGFRWQRRRGEPRLELTLESGRVVPDPTEDDIRSSIGGEEFAILGDEPDTYIQCAEQPEPPYGYILEYQDGSTDRHYQAAGPVTLDQVIAAFHKYLRRDSSWRSDFRWERKDL